MPANEAEGSDLTGNLHRRFLLAELPEDKREPLEERLMNDDELFEELLAIEDDLIDDAASGDLDAAGQDHLAAVPDLDKRIAFARALEKVSAELNAAKVHHLRPLQRRWTPWLAAAAALVVAVGLWIVKQQTGMVGQDPSTDMISVVLPSSGLRGEGTELPIAAGINRVELFLELESGGDDGPWKVVLLTQEGSELAVWKGITATSYDWGTAIRIELSAAQLTPATYSILLIHGGAPEEEPAREYLCNIVRPDQAGGLSSGE